MRGIRSQLTSAFRKKAFVKFTRPLEDGSVHGRVLDIGPQFFLLALLDEYIMWNGFQCFRISDVRELQAPAKYSGFYEAAIKKRRDRLPEKPAIDVSSLMKLLLTANQAFPLVTIHLEGVKPNVCYIGRIVDVTSGRVSIIEIGPDAAWDDQPTTYKLSEITRVDFGGAYEEALHLVAGPPPKKKS